MKRYLLLGVVAIDILWVAANPPPGDKVNPFFLYLLVFGVGGFLASIALAAPARQWRSRVGNFAAFASIAFATSTLEEIIAFVTRSGLYQDGKHALAPGLVHAGLPLFTWTLGVYVAMRLFAFSRLELFVVAGLSGWMSEAIIGGLLYKQPFLALVALPAIAFSYFVLMYLPFRAVESSVTSGGRSCWRIPSGLAIPAILWAAGGVAGVVLVKGQ
jgi:predicted ABC-type sugar transport system permease subunit